MNSLRFLALLSFSLIVATAPAAAAFDGAKVKNLVEKVKALSAANCDKPKALEVTQAIGVLEGSLSAIKDEKIRGAHSDQLRDATSDIRSPLMQAILGSAYPGPPLSDCAGKAGEAIKKINKLPIMGSETTGPAFQSDTLEAK